VVNYTVPICVYEHGDWSRIRVKGITTGGGRDRRGWSSFTGIGFSPGYDGGSGRLPGSRLRRESTAYVESLQAGVRT
jgi:hypothetical protein